jgi:hypothetical protein
VAINKVKTMQDIQEVLLKRMSEAVNSDFAELAKAYALIDAQIVSRVEKEMEWDE